MARRIQPLLVGIIWGLLSLWLFFCSLAFAEQINLLVDKTAQDEKVLLELVSNPKSNPQTIDERLMFTAALAPATSSSASLVITALASHFPTVLMYDLAALRTHQRVTVYRI